METDIFCKIVRGEIPTKTVYEDDKVLAFWDVNPQAPIHVVIVPKEHIVSLNDLTEAQDYLMGHIVYAASKIAKELNISESGYRVVANCGTAAGQSVHHIHFHLLGGRDFGWPPG